MEPPLEKHNLYLSRQVWGALKIRAFEENSNASELVTYLLEQFLSESPASLDLPRYQGRMVDPTAEERKGRSVYVPAPVWQAVQAVADSRQFSITGLVELLLKKYLGLLPEEASREELSPTPELSSGRYVKVGDKIVDLGENPRKIDLKSGKDLTGE